MLRTQPSAVGWPCLDSACARGAPTQPPGQLTAAVRGSYGAVDATSQSWEQLKQTPGCPPRAFTHRAPALPTQLRRRPTPASVTHEDESQVTGTTQPAAEEPCHPRAPAPQSFWPEGRHSP